jgi:flagellar hook-associated protein 1 FlgK
VPDNFIVTRTATGYQATDEATGQVSALGSGPTFSYDGMTLAASGTVNVGDSFEVEPTANAAQQIVANLTNPELIAAASPYVVTPGTLTSGGAIADNNAGNVVASIGGAVASGSLPAGTAIVPAADFGQKLSIEFTSATTFNVVSGGGGTVASGSFNVAAGAEIALQYPSGSASGEALTVTLSPGTPAQGDGFVLSTAGPGNSGNMAALAGLGSASLVSGQNLSDFYAGIVTTLGNQGQDAQIASQASQGVLTSAQSIQQSVSGVNLDGQAALLVSYQQAYQASAQIIATAQSLFTDLIAAVQQA